MKEILRKLCSRKLWAMLIGVGCGMATVFGLDEGLIADVGGLVMAAASLIAYMVTEGKIDAAAVKVALEAAQEAMKNEDEPEGD